MIAVFWLHFPYNPFTLCLFCVFVHIKLWYYQMTEFKFVSFSSPLFTEKPQPNWTSGRDAKRAPAHTKRRKARNRNWADYTMHAHAHNHQIASSKSIVTNEKLKFCLSNNMERCDTMSQRTQYDHLYATFASLGSRWLRCRSRYRCCRSTNGQYTRINTFNPNVI